MAQARATFGTGKGRPNRTRGWESQGQSLEEREARTNAAQGNAAEPSFGRCAAHLNAAQPPRAKDTPRRRPEGMARGEAEPRSGRPAGVQTAIQPLDGEEYRKPLGAGRRKVEPFDEADGRPKSVHLKLPTVSLKPYHKLTLATRDQRSASARLSSSERSRERSSPTCSTHP